MTTDTELRELRETNARLNRRVQIAESAINELVNGTGRGKCKSIQREMWERCTDSLSSICPHTESEGWASYAAECERHAETTRRADAAVAEAVRATAERVAEAIEAFEDKNDSTWSKYGRHALVQAARIAREVAAGGGE